MKGSTKLHYGKSQIQHFSEAWPTVQRKRGVNMSPGILHAGSLYTNKNRATPVLLLIWQVKMSAVGGKKMAYFKSVSHKSPNLMNV